VAGAIVILWNWRLALAGAVLIHLGSASVLVHIHNVPGVVAAGQMSAVLLCAAMLAIAGWLQPPAISLRQPGNWLLRSLALLFIVGAWWFLDIGYTLPSFSLLETELLIWTALCALALWSFSASPLLGGAAVLLWSTSLYALAAVLLPGSGLAAVVGIADLLVVLACSYLVLLEPTVQGRAQAMPPRFLPRMLPRLRQASGSRPWGLVRRPAQPVAPVAAPVAAPAAMPADAREEAASL
jgi:hypothetical protein